MYITTSLSINLFFITNICYFCLYLTNYNNSMFQPFYPLALLLSITNSNLETKFQYSNIINKNILIANANSNSSLANVDTTIDATESFDDFIISLKARARNEGVSEKTIDAAFRNITAPLKDSIARDRRQGEFVLSFRTYYMRTVTTERILEGQKLMQQYQELLTAAEKKYDVPADIILAFWGLESTYGKNLGKTPVLKSLVTLAYEGRRREFFTKELMAALKIIDEGDVLPENFFGSWAGAIGQVQFMPSAYLQYAVDADGDGKKDLWNSTPDIIMSAANFISQLGWKKNKSWGQEVILPENFNYNLAAETKTHSLHYWRRLGIKPYNSDQPLMNSLSLQATLILPMGYSGPAFLVMDNFFVIKRWNNSNLFALTVGILADYITGRLTEPLIFNDNVVEWKLDEIIAIQKKLIALGYLADGRFATNGAIGPATRSALQKFQNANNLVPDGYPDKKTFEKLMEQ